MSLRPWCLLVVSLFAVTVSAQQADLAVTKTGPQSAIAGSSVPYVVTVTNTGPNAAANVTITDPVPPGMTFVSATQELGPAFVCNAGNPVVCTAPSLAANGSAQFTFVFAIGAGAAPGTIFTNTATATTTTTDPNGGNNSGTAMTTVEERADLAVTKTGPASAPAGSNVSYIVAVTNFGPDPAADVTVTDLIPAGMSFVSATPAPGFSCNTPQPGDPVVCTGGSLAASQSAQFTFVFSIAAEAEPGTAFTNIATGTTTTHDVNSENNSGVATTTTPPPPSADLRLAKSGPAFAGPGTNVTFTITLGNGGPSAATNVTLSDTLPGTMTFVSLGQSGTTLGCTTPAIGAGGTITCSAATYPAGASTTLSLTANIPAGTGQGTSFDNTAVVTSDVDPHAENNVATFSVTVSSADLSVAKTGPQFRAAGEQISYTIDVINAGPLIAVSSTLTDVLPAGTTFVSIQQSGTPNTSCSTPGPGLGGTVSCDLFDLDPGATRQFTLVIETSPSATGTVNNTATVDSQNFDPDPSDDQSTASTTLLTEVDLVATKFGTPSLVVAGNNITYTISVANGGPSDAANVTLSDILPPDTTFVSLTQDSGPLFNCTTGQTVTCTRPVFAADATAAFTLVVRVASSAGGTIANVAEITTTSTDINPGNNFGLSDIPVTASADVSVTKSGPPAVAAGTNAAYTVTVANAGPSDALNVTLTDAVPVNTTFVSAQTSNGTFNCTTPAMGGTGTISCTASSLPASASTTFTFVFAVSPTATGTITNTANVTAPADPSTANNSATAASTVTVSADLSVAKSAAAAVAAGSNLTYTVTVDNAGPSTASNVTLTDVVPPGTTFVSANHTSGPTFTCGHAAGTITCTIAALAPSAAATFSFVVAVSSTATGVIDNTATVSATSPDPNPADNTSTASTAINPGPTDLSITKTSDIDRSGVGAPVTYTIAVTNQGPSTAFGTTVTDILPPGTTYQSATPSQGSCTGTTTVVCTLGTLAPSATATISLTVFLPRTPGTVSNTATVTAANAETDPADNAATAALAVSAEIPALSTYALMLLALALAVAALKGVRIQ